MGLALSFFHHVKAIPHSVISFTCQQQGNTSDKLANMIRWSISHSADSFESRGRQYPKRDLDIFL